MPLVPWWMMPSLMWRMFINGFGKIMQKPEKERQSAFTVVFEASKEIRASIFNATLIIIVAFFPLFFLSGMEGRMLKPLGISFIVSLFVSLIVAMTFTPLLSKMLLTKSGLSNNKRKRRWLARNHTSE